MTVVSSSVGKKLHLCTQAKHTRCGRRIDLHWKAHGLTDESAMKSPDICMKCAENYRWHAARRIMGK
jgi:hypothetical protein